MRNERSMFDYPPTRSCCSQFKNSMLRSALTSYEERASMCIESAQDLEGLLRVGRIVGLTLQTMEQQLRPGMTTKQLDTIGWEVLREHNARSAPLLTYRFPGITCISINDEAAHGIPGNRVIRPGDLVKIDVSAEKDGFWADAAITVAVPPVVPQHRLLVDCAKAAFAAAAAVARAQTPIYEVGRAAEATTRAHDFHIIEGLPGHGVGRALHEAPSVPMYYRKQAKTRLTEGLVITIEPHVAVGSRHMLTGSDGWVLRTQDGSVAAAHEHTVVITKDQPIFVTALA